VHNSYIFVVVTNFINN